MICKPHQLGDKIKEMGGACGTHWRLERGIHGFDGET